LGGPGVEHDGDRMLSQTWGLAALFDLGDEIRCRKSTHTVNLVRVSESGFFEALRSKLSWGER
jgi:hypothetical protein